MKYIGHLDIMRYFQKCIRKADVDIAYSGGFSPHQIMSFASPLGVGVESYGDYFDIELNSGTGKEVLERLNSVMVEGMHIESVRLLDDNSKNAMASIAAARYLVNYKSDYADKNILNEISTEQIDNLLHSDTIVVIKETKKNEIEFDIRPHIFEVKITQYGIEMLVDASSAGNLKPLVVIDELYKLAHVKCDLNLFQVTRLETYTYDSDNNLISLESVGREF